jgi:hypothetical protein
MTGPLGRVPPRLVPCPRCREFIRPSTTRCPHCSGAIVALTRSRRDQRKKERRAVADVERLIARLERVGDSWKERRASKSVDLARVTRDAKQRS